MSSSSALTHVQVQGLALTPQVHLSLKVLQAGQEDLHALVENELKENPLLESDTSPDDTEETFDLPPYEYSPLRKRMYENSGACDRAHESSACESLRDYLLSQLSLERVNPRSRLVCSFVIQSISDNGYLEVIDEDICQALNADPEEVSDAVALVQSFEPSGVGARNIKECLLIQLKKLGRAELLEGRILSEHADLLSRGQLDRIAQKEGVDKKDVCKAVRELKKLNPYPGASFELNSTDSIVPDVFVRHVNGRLQVQLNDKILPRLSISTLYGETTVAAQNDSADRYIRNRVQSARWFLHCLEQRAETLQKIAQCIVELEHEFFLNGMSSFRPLYLKDIAKRVGLHESTVSRALANKYLDTPHGIVEFKYFFTSRIETSSGEVSSLLIKEVIKSLVGREDKKKPLSDYKIADALKESQILIARRTVTKYREELGIPAASIRKLQADDTAQ